MDHLFGKEEVRYFTKDAGRCTRCKAPFAGDWTSMFMVRDTVLHHVLGDVLAITQKETVPVCFACINPDETTGPGSQITCLGCGGSMVFHSYPYRSVCSDRCAQRARRKQKASTRRCTCAACGLSFKPPRSDARFCSAACKQSAYRERVKNPRSASTPTTSARTP